MSLLSSLVGGVVWVAVGVISIAGVGAGHAHAHAQECDPVEVTKLLADDGASLDRFGSSVSIDGDTVIIGASQDDDNGDNSGAAYVFTRSGGGGGVWTQQAKLLAGDGAANDTFGSSVSLSGDTAIIGSRRDDDNGSNSGSAYVFVRSGGGVWTQQAKLLPDDGEARDQFGFSTSLSGDTAVIGAPWDGDNGYTSGSAYAFTRSGGVWTQQAKLLPDDGDTNDVFGISVSLSSDTAVIGAPWDRDSGYASGSAYAFTRSGGVWTQQAKLLAGDGAANDTFGSSVSLSGDTAVIGAKYDDDNGYLSGSAYVFTRSGSVWTQQAKLLPDDGAASDLFGQSVSLSGDTALIGAHEDDDHSYDSGAAYAFTRSGGVWTQQAELLTSDGFWGDRFGWSTAIDGDTAVIGAYRAFHDNFKPGSAYIFDLGCNDCPADLNGDGIVNTQDFIAFLGAWATGDPLADWNDDGDINTLDFLAYLTDWTAGC